MLEFIIATLKTTYNQYNEQAVNSGQLIFQYVFSKIFRYNHRCDQQNYISLEDPSAKLYKMSNKD